jgi:tetratricopeptide (TPR) repeat protein
MMDSYVCMIRTRIESLIISKKAVHLREKKDYCNSIRVFTKAIEFDSENFALYFERGMTKTLAKDHGGAALDFTTAINMGYRTKEIYANRGNSYLALKEYRKAAEDFNSALKFEKTARLFYLKGCALYSCGNHEDAYQSFLSSLLINDRDPAIHYHLSQCRYELGDMDRALEHCEKAISLDTGRTAKYFMQRGLIKERILDYDGAINDYTSAIKLDPDNAVAYERRSEAKFAKGDIEGYFEDEQEAKKNEDQF